MSFYLTNGQSWNNGYRTIGILQLILTAVLFFSLPLWKRQKDTYTSDSTTKALSFNEILKLKGIWAILIAFFAYSAVEQTTGLWASTFLVTAKNIHPDIAARFAAFFFLGITFGRFICGFIADRLGDKQLIRVGTGIILIGLVFILLPSSQTFWVLSGLIIVGVGCAPIYPSIIHATPTNFGKEYSQSVIGIQMAFAYVGTTFVPPFFGWLASVTSLAIYPFFLAFFALLMLFSTERLNQLLKLND